MVGGSRRIAVVLASVLLAGPVMADPKGPSDKDKQLAGELVKKAIAQTQAGDFAAAIDLYLQAYSVIPNPALYSNIGACYQQSGRPKEALTYFCMYLELEKNPKGASVPYAKAQAKSLQIQLGNKNVDERDVCAPPPKDEPKDEPNDGTNDGPKTGSKGGSKTGSKGGSKTGSKGGPEGGSKGGLEGGSKDGPGGGSIEPEGEPGATRSGGSKLKYLGLGVGAAGLAAAGIGTYYGLQAKKLSDQLTNHPVNMPWPDNIKDIQKQGKSYGDRQTGFLIAGGVLVTIGVVMFVMGRSDESSKRSTDKTTVMVTPTTDGVAVFGTF